MRMDRYDNALSTTSDSARDAYIKGVDHLISANHGAEDAFQEAIAADDNFALGYAALARAQQISGKISDAQTAIQSARERASNTSEREQSHIAVLSDLIGGNGPAAYTKTLAHLDAYPTDAFIVQPCTGVFGLIGFSGEAGREAEQLAFMNRLHPHYGDDWWFGSLLAFAQVEAGQTDRAIKTIETSLAQNPRSAHGAHIRAHIYYERGETKAGFDYIDTWRKDYDKRAPLHCHVSWHVALWALEQGEKDRAWKIIEDDVMPDGAWGPALNVLTDAASFLMRAELAGDQRRDDLWGKVSQFAARVFPNPGIAFADVHAALAHAMAGDRAALEKIVRDAKGPVGPIVSTMADAFGAFARQEFAQVVQLLGPVMSAHERIGGSRAQRDLIEFTLLNALLRLGRDQEAAWLLASRRPAKVAAHPVAGL